MAAKPRGVGRPLRLGKPQRPFPPTAAHTHPSTAAEDAPAGGSKKEPRPPPEPAPAGLSPLRPAARERNQYSEASGDPETLDQEVTSQGGGPKGRPDRGCALGRGTADGHGR